MCDQSPARLFDLLTLQALIESAQTGRGSDTSLVYVRENPLVYIDGVEATDEQVSGLSPDMIARVEILKAAAALSLYGERGANGAILIFTKKDDISETGRQVNR